MPWLRIDDGFANHPKIASLTDREFRVWMRLLCYCARYPTVTGRVTLASRTEITGLDAKTVAKYVDAGLLDTIEAGLWEVHDWAFYNTRDVTAAERAKRYRDSKRDETSQETSRERHDEKRDASRARAGSRARPVPSPTTGGEERPLGATPPLPQLDQPAESAERSPASPSNGRAVDPDEWFGGDQKQKRGKPAEVVGDKPKPFKRKPAEAYVRNVGWLDPHPADALRAQYADIPDDDLIELVELAAELARAHDPSTDPVGGAAA